MENLLEIHVCFTNQAHRLPTNLTNADILGQGNLAFGQRKVREMSGNFAFYNLWEPCKTFFILNSAEHEINPIHKC